MPRPRSGLAMLDSNPSSNPRQESSWLPKLDLRAECSLFEPSKPLKFKSLWYASEHGDLHQAAAGTRIRIDAGQVAVAL
jgi:hypothetical protein